jgi:hypothetical protein
MKIYIENVYADNDMELEKKLNDLEASHIVSLEHGFDSQYKVIYEK